MATPAKQPKVNFVWEDSAIGLLLQCMLSFKANSEQENVDWESIKTKYNIIHSDFVKALQERGDESPDKYTKERVVAKVKGLRLRYKAAVDSGKRSGGGRVVCSFFDQCSQVWGGSPAVESLENSIDTNSLNDSLQEEETAASDQECFQPNRRRKHRRLEQRATADPYLEELRKDGAARRQQGRELLEHLKETDKQQTVLLQSLVAASNSMANAIGALVSNMSSAPASGASDAQADQLPPYHHL